MSFLFSPYSINRMEVKNRFVHSAKQECMSGDNGEVTDGHGADGLKESGHIILKSCRKDTLSSGGFCLGQS